MSRGRPDTGTSTRWERVCPVDDLEVDRGVTALVHGQAIAIFRTRDDEIHALGNYDPFARASVLARGIVGRRAGVPFVAGPVHRHAFDLRTGRCLDDATHRVPVYDVLVRHGTVLVGGRKDAADP